jgi:hypothetical protein
MTYINLKANTTPFAIPTCKVPHPRTPLDDTNAFLNGLANNLRTLADTLEAVRNMLHQTIIFRAWEGETLHNLRLAHNDIDTGDGHEKEMGKLYAAKLQNVWLDLQKEAKSVREDLWRLRCCSGDVRDYRFAVLEAHRT